MSKAIYMLGDWQSQVACVHYEKLIQPLKVLFGRCSLKTLHVYIFHNDLNNFIFTAKFSLFFYEFTDLP